jgi:tetratricopeptide (TPR) repeat protein
MPVSAQDSAKAQAAKEKGNAAFKAKKYADAIASYTEAIAADASDHTFFSNRAMCQLGLSKFDEARKDAEECIRLSPAFVKGYHRLGSAWMGLKQFEGAVKACEAGLKVAADNKDLLTLLNEARPLAAKAKEARIAKLQGSEQARERGNALFKAAKFDAAAEAYTKAIDLGKTDEEKAKAYNNRAACWKELRDHTRMMEDTTWVLERDPANIKALTRRCVAYEAIESYKKALLDARAVLALDKNNVVANGVQHRCGKACRELGIEV